MCFPRDKFNVILQFYILFRLSLDFHLYEQQQQQHESVLVHYSEKVKIVRKTERSSYKFNI